MLTEIEFNRRIMEIDKEQSEENIPLFARPLEAINRYSMKYKTSILMGGHKWLAISKDKFDSTNLADSISEWYNKKYGDRTKKDFSRGYVGLLLSGTVYKMKIPLIFGKVLVYPDAKKELSPSSDDGTMFLNVFELIDDYTVQIGLELTPEEIQHIMNVFCDANELFDLLSKEMFRNLLCESAKEDIRYSVDCLLYDHFNIGQSKWASLQATEKILKSILNHYKVQFEKTHNLQNLLEKLEKLNFPSISNDIFESIQCSASIRYGQVPYSLIDAIKAHHNSIYLCKQYLSHVYKRKL